MQNAVKFSPHSCKFVLFSLYPSLFCQKFSLIWAMFIAQIEIIFTPGCHLQPCRACSILWSISRWCSRSLFLEKTFWFTVYWCPIMLQSTVQKILSHFLHWTVFSDGSWWLHGRNFQEENFWTPPQKREKNISKTSWANARVKLHTQVHFESKNILGPKSFGSKKF